MDDEKDVYMAHSHALVRSQSHFTSGAAGQSCPPRQRDIAAEAYSDAIQYLEGEFKGNEQALAWLKNATSTSLNDLLGTTREAERKYRQASQNTNSRMRWLRGLSARVMYYGQILDTLSQHHPEYVALVWGVIKFVLMGIISHGNLVVQFSQALSMISHVLPITKVSAELYQTDQMKDAVASLYAHILLFLQQAVKWYNIGPAGRLFKALLKPYELSYKETVDQIKLCAQTIDDIADIAVKAEVREINIFLQEESQKLAEREKKLHDMQVAFGTGQAEISTMVRLMLQILSRDTVKLGEVHLDVKEMKPRVLDMHFNHVLSVLKPRRSPDEALLKHRSLVRRASPWRNQNQNTGDLLDSIGKWISTPNASLLVLQTQPRAQARVKEIATELIGLLQPQSKRVIWYLSAIGFQDDGTACTIEVIQTLVFQCLKLAPDLVGSDPDNFNTAKLHAPHSEEEWFDLLFGVLRRLPTCFVIIEAEDVIKDPEESRRLMEILRLLANRLDLSATGIKLLVVSYDGAWPGSGGLETSNGTVIDVGREIVSRRMRRPGNRSIFRGASWNKTYRAP